MSSKTDFIFKLLNLLSGVIFVGLCIDAGGLVFNSIYALFINPIAASRFWDGLDLSDLYRFNQGGFIAFTGLMLFVSLLKAGLFYLILTVFHKSALNISQPFNAMLGRCIFNISYLALGIGVFSFAGTKTFNWLINRGITMPAMENLKLSGNDVWFFMGVTLLIFAKIFKRGIELQTENELTV